MKKLILLVGLFVFYQATYGQCEKKVTFKCKTARGFHKDSVGQDFSMNATIAIDKGKYILTFTINEQTETIEGEIQEISICSWKEYLKNGKTKYKALTKRIDEDIENTIIEIESDNNYTKITFSSEADPTSKLQLDVAEYQITDDIKINNLSVKPGKKVKKQKKKQG